MTQCRIYKPTKNAMQSGRATLETWVLEYLPSDAKRADSLMGWIGSGDTRTQIRLKFPSKEDAVAYAKKEGLSFRVIKDKVRRIQAKSYSENFSPRFRFP